MPLSIRQKRKLRISGFIIITGICLGLFYALLSDGFTAIFPYINGAVTGILVGSVISILELQILDTSVRRLPFIALLLLRTALYVFFIPIVIFFELITARVIRYDMTYNQVYQSEEFQNYILNQDFSIVIIYTIILSLLVNFAYQISRKMGQGVLWNYLTGKYRQPFDHERIFLFMHISNSDQIINQTGSVGFLEFLNRVFYDITESILLYRGIIYEYVEDECVISWKLDNKSKNANCLRSVFDILDTIEKRSQFYLSKYGFIPRFEMSLHQGKVLQGEIGVLKSEVAFYGDVMNITSRILAQCGELGKNVIISDELKQVLTPPKFCRFENLGDHNLKGAGSSLKLFAVSKV